MGSTTTLAVMPPHNKTSHAVSHVLSPPVPGKLLICIKSVLPPGCARDWYLSGSMEASGFPSRAGPLLLLHMRR